MRTLGTVGFGRFGNQVFQYAFAKLYASRYSLSLETSPWIGQYLFGHHEPPVSYEYPVLKSTYIQKMLSKKNLKDDGQPPFVGVDIQGQFMFAIPYYRSYRREFRELFQPNPVLAKKLEKGMKQLEGKGRSVVGLHIRRGDFLNEEHKNSSKIVPTPTGWYLNWLEQLWPKLQKSVLFIASDDLPKVLPDFQQYQPVTSEDLISGFPTEPRIGRLDPSFYPDFYYLTQCDVMAISNSTFSFSASLLNTRGKQFFRPHITKKLVSYDPWRSEARLKLR